MRRYSRTLGIALFLLVGLVSLIQLPHPLGVRAGEPIRVGGPAFGTDGGFFIFPAQPISYRTDGGNLGTNTTPTATFVDNMFGLWVAVPSSNIDFTNAGLISAGPGGACVPDGDVNTIGEFNCLNTATSGNPIIYDVDGSLTDAILGPGASNGVLGFAGPFLTSAGGGTISGGRAVLNGKFIDGINTPPTNPETSVANMQATALHEFGHFFGLGHSQVNDNCFTAPGVGTCNPFPTSSEDSFGLPTMYPISFGLEEAPGVPAELTLAADDIAWVSRLYPDPTFSTTHGTISGTVFFSDGITHLQGGNVIARQKDDPATPSVNESRRCAVSTVSGYRFTGNPGIGTFTDNQGNPENPGSPFGSRNATLIGTYDIPVPAVAAGNCAGATVGTYAVEVESINPSFLGGSGVGPLGSDAGIQIALPGAGAEFFSSPENNADGNPGAAADVGVAAGITTGNIDIILNGTPPRFDSIDGVALNDTPATATPVGNGTTVASISPFTSADVDVYSFTAPAGATVNLEIFAQRLGSPLDPIIEVVDSSGTRVNICRQSPTAGSFTFPCTNDDDPVSATFDSRLELNSPPGGVFFLRVLDVLGGARPDYTYNLVVSGAGATPGGTADIVVTKTDSADPVNIGQQFTYTITVANQGPDPATAVTVNDTLTGPANTIGTITPSAGTCGAPSGGVFSCNLGTVNVGTPVTITVQVTPNAAGTLTNTVSATTTATDPTPGNNTNIVQTTTVTAPAPGVGFAPTSVAFGDQPVNTTSGTTNVQVSNTGTATLNISGITKTGADPTQFNLVAPTGGASPACSLVGATAVPAAASCFFGVKFAPTSTGAKSANASIASDASGSPHTVPLTGNGIAATVALTPNPVAFGDQRVGTTSTAQTVTVTNNGTASANITGITLTGADAAQFNLVAPGSGTPCPLGASVLAAGANCTVGANFAPTTTGAKSANVSVASDASGSPHTTALTGNGTQSQATPNPANVNFGDQVITTTSAPRTITVTNGGTATLNIATVALGGADAAHFAIAAGTTCTNASTVAPGANCIINTTFTPATTGVKNATITLTDDAPNSPQNIPLTGNGVPPPAVSLNPTSLSFGNQRVGTTSAAQGVTVTNTGGSNLVFSSISITGANAGDFAIAAGTTCSTSSPVAPTASCLINATFGPAGVGARAGDISIASNAPGSPHTVPMTGTGTQPAVTLNPTSVTFADQRVGTTSATQNIQVTNSGTDTLNITGITKTGTDPTQFNLVAPTGGASPACSLAGATGVPAGASCFFGVNFAPTTTGPKSANASIASDAPGSPHTVPLSGAGTQPAVTLNPTSLTFPPQAVGTSAVMTVTLTNSGTDTLNIATRTITGANAADFGFATFGPSTCVPAVSIPAGASCIMDVRFAPTAIGTRTATINITDDALGSPHTVALTGSTPPAVTLSSTNLTFGNQQVGAASATQNVTLTNSGGSPLTINSITRGGANAGDFTLSDSCPDPPATLAAGANCAITGGFQPTATGARSANISITSNAPSSPDTVNLTGNGIDYAIAAAMPNTATIPAGQSANFTINLTTSGGAGLQSAVNYTATGLPAASTGAFNPASTPAGSTSGSTTFTIMTTARSAVPPPPSVPLQGPRVLVPWALLFLMALGALLIRQQVPQRKLLGTCALLILVLGSVALVGCNGGQAGTPAGTSTIAVTATSGSVTRTAQVTLTVQ